MTTDEWPYDVTPDQVFLARELIRRRGGVEFVSPRIAEVASRPLEEIQAAWDRLPVNEEKVHAARLLIELRGSEQFVPPHVVAIAHTKLVPATADQS